MVKSFVNTFKRNYMSRMDLCDAPTVLAQSQGAFEYFNEIHPHLSLKMMLSRKPDGGRITPPIRANLATRRCLELRGQDH